MSEHKTLLEALAAFQAEAPTLKKDSINPHFKSKFASLDGIVETIKPLLAKHGLVWVTLPGRDADGTPVLNYRLVHATSELADPGTFRQGDWLGGSIPLLLTKNDPQGQGSAITYARRYALCAVLNLVADEDDDGNAGSQKRAVSRPVGLPVSDLAKVRLKVKEYADKGLPGERIRLKLAAVGFTEPYDRLPEALPHLTGGQATTLIEWLAEQIEAA